MDRDSKAVHVAWEDEVLNDLVHHAGWKIIKELAKVREDSLFDLTLIPAAQEWDAIKKESVLASVRELRGFFSGIEGRAKRFRTNKER